MRPAYSWYLADSDDTGLDVVLKALLVASDDINGTGFLYRDADRGGTDTPLDGDMLLGGTDEGIGESAVSRIGWNGSAVTIFDNDNPQTLNLATYFNVGGIGNDLTLYFQTTANGEEAVIVAGNSFGVNASRLRLTAGANLANLLSNITTGDRFIFKFARAAVSRNGLAGCLCGCARTLGISSSNCRPARGRFDCRLGGCPRALRLGSSGSCSAGRGLDSCFCLRTCALRVGHSGSCSAGSGIAGSFCFRARALRISHSNGPR